MTTEQPSPAQKRPGDTHFEVLLDGDPDDLVLQTAPVETPEITAQPQKAREERKPILPPSWHSWQGFKNWASYHADLARYRALYHGWRLPVIYVPLALLWSTVGLLKVAGRQIRWWWVLEQHRLRQEAATRNDPATWLLLHREARHTRAWRGSVLASEAIAVLAALGLLWWLAPWWLQLLAAAVAVCGLAHYGRPVDKPIVSAAVVVHRLRRLNPDIVLRAYYSAKLGDPDKAKVEFLSTMARDTLETGSHVHIALAHGRTFADTIKAKGALASGLDVSEFQVFLTRDRKSERSHFLFVADEDPLAIPAGRTDMLDLKRRDIWKPIRFGLDERGRRVEVPLIWHSILVGAQPRKGKTFSARLLALHAALDPWVKLVVADGKNSPDWRKFTLVAHRIVFGTTPNRDGDPVEMLIDALEEIKAHIVKVNEVLSTLPVDVCPEGKLTPELARDPRYPDLRVWLLVMEEFQCYFELEDQDKNKEVASLLSFIISVGPSAGVILLSSSQKPSGVGAGDVGRLFNRYRDNHAVRFALKCGNRDVSMAVLGGDAYGEGYDASALPMGPEYRGVGYLYGLTDETPTVRTHLADAADAEKVLLAARRHREAAGTLSGYAAGEEATKQVRDVLADVMSVFLPGEDRLQWQTLAARLTDVIAEAYAGTTSEAISAQVRAFGVPSVNVRDGDEVLKGCLLDAVKTAIARRDAARSGSGEQGPGNVVRASFGGSR
ncbi:cell division protein FtsK [Phytohabitans sp. ZYX-F-186]|uniref:Cell division protein FtsK n=1 Tax=Phytohabitans maris TaxID=3071409 RepID=A0ABU0ZUT6_9ACTN|nr:cell division protein FtsK [Phytohabitans sp. ZYX-F-186]MDQ7910800.1 cell division protein FtsK [Phytohabitans sp. ZYX-F-186]